MKYVLEAVMYVALIGLAVVGISYGLSRLIYENKKV